MTSELDMHIMDKIYHHEELRMVNEATENYEQCVIHRDEIKRLESMLTVPPTKSLVVHQD